MNWETWEKYKAALANENWTAWGRWNADLQAAFQQITPERTDLLCHDGTWSSRGEAAKEHKGSTYRVSPSWPGPAKPEPVAEYEDVPVLLVGVMYRFSIPNSDGTQWTLTAAPTVVGFAGYVMPDGKLRSTLSFDQQTDGTWRLRVPKAVRLRKEGGQ